jgi:hypothetical protein
MTVSCPFCNSEDVEIVSPWGGQIITCQARCRRCKTYFEAIRGEFGSRSWPDVDGPEPNSPWESGSSPEGHRDQKGRIP